MLRSTRPTRTRMLLAVALLILVPGTALLANPVQTPYVQAELGSTVATIQPGASFWVCLLYTSDAADE